MWKLRCIGRLFHSGWASQGINAIELAMEAVAELQVPLHSLANLPMASC